VYVPATVLDAVRVSGLKLGPHEGKVDWLTASFTRRGLFTAVVRTTVVRKGGAHLNGSVALPAPVVCEKVMVIGFVVQTTFGGELEELGAKTEAYETPRIEIKAAATRICGKYCIRPRRMAVKPLRLK